jgi:hypothetical protein
MALQNVDILQAMEKDLGRRMQTLRVDGGAAANDLLMQTQADYLGRKLVRPRVLETTVVGASYLAGLGVGLWRNEAQLKRLWQVEREFSVSLSRRHGAGRAWRPGRRRCSARWRRCPAAFRGSVVSDFNQPLSGNEMPRFGGIASLFRLPVQANPDDLDIAIVGVPLDCGTSNRAGSRYGPRQMRAESVLVRPYAHGDRRGAVRFVPGCGHR